VPYAAEECSLKVVMVAELFESIPQESNRTDSNNDDYGGITNAGRSTWLIIEMSSSDNYFLTSR